jgi:hypothetical protein
MVRRRLDAEVGVQALGRDPAARLPVDVDERERHRELGGARAQRAEDLDTGRAEDLEVVEIDHDRGWCVLGEETVDDGALGDESHVEGTADPQLERLGERSRR